MHTPIRVLIVEHSIDKAHLFLGALRNGGYEPTWERVETEHDMAIALATYSWDVVLANSTLPHFSALAALQVLQARGTELPLFVVSDHVDEATAAAVIKAGARDCFVKENLARLVPAIERELHRTQDQHLRKTHAAHFYTLDELTGLPNRTLLDNELTAAVHAMQTRKTGFSLLYLDLDRFQAINDTFGYRWGDFLLQQVVPRLQGALRKADTVARVNGDEFAVVLPNLGDAGGAVRIARRLLHLLEPPFQIEGHKVGLSASIGIGLCPEHGTDTDTLLRRAALAVHQAKRTGIGYALYSVEQEEIYNPTRLLLLNDLRQAAEHEQLILHYQPKVEMTSGAIQQVEALIRWQRPQRGVLPPDVFLPLAEESGLMKSLSQWVLNEAIRQCRAWGRDGIHLRVAVNLSMQDLQDTQFPQHIAGLLTAWGLDPGSLEVEVTEAAIVADIEKTHQSLAELHRMGVRIAIDDFGTGSSLTHLRQLPVDTVKIGKSFVRGLTKNESDAAIVRGTIELGHNLGLRVVAEGVEDQMTWDALAALACDLVQGYLISHPLPAEALQQWLGRAGGQMAPLMANVASLRQQER